SLTSGDTCLTRGGTSLTSGDTCLTSGDTSLTRGGTCLTSGGTSLTRGGTCLTTSLISPDRRKQICKWPRTSRPPPFTSHSSCGTSSNLKGLK
uniref:Uncharacterized protein n=1 Tax=Takifugu rubripes TaxID=31033 RepID=A0A674N5I3_TAKRU